MACPCLVVPGDEHAGRVLFSCAPQPRVGSPLPSRVHRVVRSHSGFRFSRRSLASVTFSPSPQICRAVARVQNMIRRTLPLHLRCYCTMPDIMPSPAAEVVKSADSGKEKTSRGQECPVLLESLVPEIRVPVLFYIAVGLKLHKYGLPKGWFESLRGILNRVASLLSSTLVPPIPPSAVMPFRALVQTPMFSVSPSAFSLSPIYSCSSKHQQLNL